MDISLTLAPRLPSMAMSMSGSFTASTFSGLGGLSGSSQQQSMAFVESLHLPLSLSDCLQRFSEGEVLEDVECTHCTFLEYVSKTM